MPLISFIITYYNLPSDMLRLCVESIVNLSINRREREIILIDDGSDINPTGELGLLAQEILYIRQDNGGLSDARNHGMKIAKGRYIQFVDGDDALVCNEYTKCISVLKTNDVDMLLFKLTNKKIATTEIYHTVTSGTSYMSSNNIRSTACGYIFKKSIAERLMFTKGIYHEDDEFTPLLMLNADTLISTGYNAYWYRERIGSITTNKDQDRISKRLDDKRDVILRLKSQCSKLNMHKREALTRRVNQLTMDYIYTCIVDLNNCKKIKERLEELRPHNLYPLTTEDYTKKYKWFRIVSSCNMGISLLTVLLPLIKKER